MNENDRFKPYTSNTPSNNSPQTSTQQTPVRQTPTQQTPTPNSLNSRPLTPEEKLARSSRNLSYTAGAGIGNSHIDLSRYARKPVDPGAERKKVGGIVLDVDTIQDVTSQRMNTKDKRNRVIILVLVLALIVSLLFLTITVLNYQKGTAPATCFFKIEGDAGSACGWLIENEDLTEFNPPDELNSTSVYELKSQLVVNTNVTVTLQLTIDVTCNGKPFLITQLHNPNPQLERLEDTNNFVYLGTITGPKIVDLFEGIDFTSSPEILSSQNLRMTVTAIVVQQKA